MANSRSKVADAAIIGIYRLLLFVFIMGSLYYGQSLLIPLTLAALLTFLLSPLVTRIENWLGRLVAIFLVVTFFLMSIAVISYVLTNQLIEFTSKLPDYRTNIESKLESINVSHNSFNQMWDSAEKYKNQFGGLNTQSSPSLKNALPTPVNIVAYSSSDLTTFIKNLLSSFLDIMTSTGLIFLLVIFMLFNRDNLRGRLIQLIGPRRISKTTLALNDASERVRHFLFIKLLINLFFGAVVSVGLYFIGIPNAFLWGGLSVLLRFIPYIGIFIAAIIPCLLALAISSTWLTPIVTVLLFGILDLIASNVIEPLLFSSRTGISSLALIVSAVFWTLLWGPLGLLLSIPLTVCIVVMGRHIPTLTFLSVLFSDEAALAVYEECYQRLIALELSEVVVIITNYLKNNTLLNLFDTIIIPILSAAITDRQQDFIDEDQLTYLYQNVQDILFDVFNLPDEKPLPVVEQKMYKVLCIPAESEADEIAGMMLAKLLKDKAFEAEILAGKLSREDILNKIENGSYDTICISLVAPASLMRARPLFTLLRHRFPELKIILGLWGHVEMNPEIEHRLQVLGINATTLSYANAIDQFENLRQISEKIN